MSNDARYGAAAAARRLAAGLLLAALASIEARAQTGAITGRVTDARGAAIAGAEVTATAPGAAPAVAATGTDGAYRLPALAPGTYAVTVATAGFRTARRTGVAVAAGAARTVDLQLAVAPFAQRVDVVGVAPVGDGVSRERIPATVSVLTAGEIMDRQASSLADTLHERLGAVTLEGTTTNLLQPTLRFRGFTASPLLGLPQGVAVHQHGVRINEPFGDTVQFDLIPQFAIDEAQLSAGAEPAFGLNALGGTLALRLKNGFDHAGLRADLSGGSFDRFSGTAEWGGSRGPWAAYVGATRFDETGWRAASPSEVTQAFADVAFRNERIDAGVSFTYADSRLNGNGPAPVELLAVDRSAVFTYPDTTENRLAFVQGRYEIAAAPAWAVQVTGYYRDLDRRTLNGDEAEFGVCDDDALPPGAPAATLCAGGGGDDDDDDDAEEAHPLVDVRTGRFVTEDDTAGDAAFNRTATRSKGYGATVQAVASSDLGGRENVLTFGLSADLADVDFSSNSEIGALTADRTVSGSGLLAGVFGAAPDDRFNTGIETANRAVGLYFSDTLSITSRTHLTVSGRFNHARIAIADRLGTALDGEHAFSRLNVGVGAVHQAGDAVSVFGRYAESNRAPTAAELSCADPAEPCRVPNAFISDPPLEQTVARSVEGGLRGRATFGAAGSVDWSVAVYRTAIGDDILFVASPELIGTGYFRNAGDTRRIGVDAEVNGRAGRLGWYAGYGLVHATFESRLELPGDAEVNAAATAEGALRVEPGDRLPGVPRHSFKGGVRFTVTDPWDVMLETVAASSRVFVGDEGNDQAPLDGYRIANLRSVYRAGGHAELFVRIDNLFGTDYATFGALAELEVFLREAPDARDPRFVGPGAPRSGFAGIRLRF